MIYTPLGRLPLDPVPCGRALESKQLLTGHHNRGSGGVYFSRVLLRFQWTISPSILTFYDHLCSLCIHSWRIHRALLMTRAPTVVLMCTRSFCPLSQPHASSDLLTFFTIRCSLFRHEAISWFSPHHQVFQNSAMQQKMQAKPSFCMNMQNLHVKSSGHPIWGAL